MLVAFKGALKKEIGNEARMKTKQANSYMEEKWILSGKKTLKNILVYLGRYGKLEW